MNEPAAPQLTHAEAARRSFFRQSAWMMFATVASGGFMAVIHFLYNYIPRAEYGNLCVYLQLINWLTIPAVGLRMVFAHQTSSALTESAQRELTGTMRAILKSTFGLWLAMAAVLAVGQSFFQHLLQLTNPAGLWATLLVALAMMWLPVTQGIMQGQQNFLWLGTVEFSNGFGRFLSAFIIVLCLGGYATGIMLGALLGMLLALTLGTWQTWSVLTAPTGKFQWRPWLAQVLPLTLGFGSSQYLFSADMIFVQSHFQDTDPYGAAGTLGRALVAFTGPLAAVMFPKLVRSHKKAERTDVLWLTLLGTALLGGTGALCLTFLAPRLIPFVFRANYASIIPLVPWFAWCMLPLAMANVLINNLMAKSHYAAVPWLAAVAVGYTIVLPTFGLTTFTRVIQTLGAFNLLLLLVAAWFSWRTQLKNRPTQ